MHACTRPHTLSDTDVYAGANELVSVQAQSSSTSGEAGEVGEADDAEWESLEIYQALVSLCLYA